LDIMELSQPEQSSGQPHLLFQIGAFTLALPLTAIQSVERPGRFTTVPFASPWLRGVTAVGGAVMSVVDLGRFAGGAPAGTTPGARLLVCHSGNVSAGLLVDSVGGLASVPEELASAPAAGGPLAGYWRGAHQVDGEIVFVLDHQRLLHSTAFQAYQAAPDASATIAFASPRE